MSWVNLQDGLSTWAGLVGLSWVEFSAVCRVCVGSWVSVGRLQKLKFFLSVICLVSQVLAKLLAEYSS